VKQLKDRLNKRDLTIGSWITIGHPSVAEIMATAGFDWLAIDMEHSAITLDQAFALIQVIELSGIPPLVRVGENDPVVIKRVMDAGAHGVIVPMVNTPEDAQRAVDSVKYPPGGKRGVGLARAQKYGMGFEAYRRWNQEKSVVIVQIEHILGVENFDAIFSVEGVDGFIAGPYDLSGSLGIPGQFDHPRFKKAIAMMEKKARAKKALAGYHVVPPEPEAMREKIRNGYRFLSYSVDFLLLGATCRKDMAAIRSFAEKSR
jgi:2-dehydro-3-deoxyglucarate aldolase